MSIVLLLGAGATVAEVTSRPKKRRPPLDKGFFGVARATNPDQVRSVRRYIDENYGFDIIEPRYDSLEAVMAHVYTDLFVPELTALASRVFSDLMLLFNDRLATTTNNIDATPGRLLYRLIDSYLKNRVRPDEITIITFNYDLQVEKTLFRLANSARGRRYGPVFKFPNCYHLGETKVTGPTGSRNLFPVTNDGMDGIPVPKLHGSLNWYSLYRDRNPTPTMLLKNDREIRITTRRSINPNFRYIGGARAQNTRPVVVPPVSHKSGILHAKLRDIWALAEARLIAADELLIFGYSCPPIDFESVNMLQRGFGLGSEKLLRIIDPDSAALMRYVELLQPTHCEYFPTAKAFLSHVA